MRKLLAAVFVIVCGITAMVSAYSGGTGEPNNPYQIADANDLIQLGNDPCNYDKCFVLTADIDLSGYTFAQAVIAPDLTDNDSGFQGTKFTGKFDGRGYVIRNLHIQGNDCLGLFGIIEREAVVTNVGLEDTDITGIDKHGGHIGALAGYSSGYISSSYSTGTVIGDEYVGGLVISNMLGSVVTSSFWDIDTSGQSTSDGGSGLPTVDMQSIDNFLNAGWDFVNETDNGTDDIWFMPENDCPKLWWQEPLLP